MLEEGPIIFSGNARKILEGTLYQMENPAMLKPKAPKFYLDEYYILYAVGLLSQVEPEKALSLARKYLKQI